LISASLAFWSAIKTLALFFALYALLFIKAFVFDFLSSALSDSLILTRFSASKKAFFARCASAFF